MKVLIAEDDLDQLDVLTYTLRREGYTVLGATDGLQALQRWEHDAPDLVLLDGAMPKLDGVEVCRRIRQDSETPVILLTGRTAEEDILRGLHAGADDYIAKPFSAKQLVARMTTVLRRAKPNSVSRPARQVRVGDLVLDLQSHQAWQNGVPVQLTRLEFRILYVLALNAGWVLPYAQIIEFAWGDYAYEYSKVLKTHICHIREKLGLSPKGTDGIKVIIGVGYQFVRPDQAVPAPAERAPDLAQAA